MGSWQKNFFADRQPELMKTFGNLMKVGGDVFRVRYGTDVGGRIINEAMTEFEQLIPKMPRINQGDELTDRHFILGTIILSIYNAMKKRGKPIGEIWELCSHLLEARFKAYPWFFKMQTKRKMFSKRELDNIRIAAAASQEMKYPDDFVYEYVEGNGDSNGGGNGEEDEFDWGLDFTECALCKFYKVQGAGEFLPYICDADRIFSEVMAYGFKRTQSLAQGFDRCNLRFSKKGDVHVTSIVLGRG